MTTIYHNHIDVDRGDCSTVIFGKNASVTGKVIMAHNEDDTDVYVQTHLVPRKEHKEGEMVVFEDGKAIIPQVPVTNAYLWSEIKCKGGISFADCFLNEHGVAVASNSCKPCKDIYDIKTDNRENYGLGYAMRTLIAERATSARHGVEVAMELVEKYGYVSSRSYHIADKDEAWVVSIPKGFNCVARRIGDDEIYFIPNHFTIHEIDFNDPDNFRYTKNLVPYAIEHGWYKPAKDGDWSDFDFAAAYQDGPDKEGCVRRSKGAWKILTGNDLPDKDNRIFSMKATRKYSRDDAKAVLRSHFEGTDDDTTNGGTANPHKGFNTACPLCNNMTVESTIFEFDEDINLTKMFRAMPKPCLNPYTPWFGVALQEVPQGYEHQDVRTAKLAHFDVGEGEMKFDPSKAWWAFKNVQYFTDLNYAFAHEPITASIKKVEAAWDKELPGVEAAYKKIAETDPEAAKKYLSDYTCVQARKAVDWAWDMVDTLAYKRIHDDLYD